MMAFVFVIAMVIAVIVAPVAAYAAVRVVMRTMEVGRSAVPNDALDARLTRIEEAIDTMAVQIERLADNQRLKLGPAPDRDS